VRQKKPALLLWRVFYWIKIKKRDYSGTKRLDKEKGVKYLLLNPLILMEPMTRIELVTY